MTGGRGRAEMLEFYGRHFIPKMPADTAITAVCRTVSVRQERVIDEMIFSFTHDLVMDWMLPGVAATGRHVEVPLVVVVQLKGDEIVSERSTGIRRRCGADWLIDPRGCRSRDWRRRQAAGSDADEMACSVAHPSAERRDP